MHILIGSWIAKYIQHLKNYITPVDPARFFDLDAGNRRIIGIHHYGIESDRADLCRQHLDRSGRCSATACFGGSNHVSADTTVGLVGGHCIA